MMETSDARKRHAEERGEMPESTSDYIRRLCRELKESRERVAELEELLRTSE